jgi:KRAB domain-containing zinc finger protein
MLVEEKSEEALEIESTSHETGVKAGTALYRFICTFENCGYRTHRKFLLNQHARIHTEEKPYKCPACRFAAAQLATLRRHERTHRDEKTFKCSHPGCSFAAKQKYNLQQHVKEQHTAEEANVKRFKCSYEGCPYSAKRKEHLDKHTLKHTGEKPHQCPHCDHTTAQKSSLNLHIKRIHTQEKPFKCEFERCQYATVTPWDLEKHRLTHGKSPDKEGTAILASKRPKCEVPGCTFSTTDSSLIDDHFTQHLIDISKPRQ